jgi:hypothetical protein
MDCCSLLAYQLIGTHSTHIRTIVIVFWVRLGVI